jgi:hypothetical protein
MVALLNMIAIVLYRNILGIEKLSHLTVSPFLTSNALVKATNIIVIDTMPISIMNFLGCNPTDPCNGCSILLFKLIAMISFLNFVK